MELVVSSRTTVESFYRDILGRLTQVRVPFLVGGAIALRHYTAITRATKDVDVFLRQGDLGIALRAFSEPEWNVEVTHPHWLAKVSRGEQYADLIYGAGNGVAVVDEAWFQAATAGTAWGMPVRFCPIEEMIWSKAFVMERERFDGADVLHLLRAGGRTMDWRRLLRRFGSHWPVLLAHLVLFGFVYPHDQESIPAAVMRHLLARARRGRGRPTGLPVCRGTLLSRAQYLVDVEHWGLRDGRLPPETGMTAADIEQWTDQIAPAVRPGLFSGREGTMDKDPVCGMAVRRDDVAARSEYQGRTYYFCSPGCKERFDVDPRPYAVQRLVER